MFVTAALVASLSLLAVSCHRPVRQSAAAQQARSGPPTGRYCSGPPVPLTVVLYTAGAYEVRSDRRSQRGLWKWDEQHQEFSLVPLSEGFPLALRRLRVDRDDPNCLQWIPVPLVTSGGGALDYVRFKRQKD